MSAEPFISPVSSWQPTPKKTQFLGLSSFVVGKFKEQQDRDEQQDSRDLRVLDWRATASVHSETSFASRRPSSRDLVRPPPKMDSPVLRRITSLPSLGRTDRSLL